MTTAAETTAVAALSASPYAVAGRRRSRQVWWISGAALLLLGGGGASWWGLSRFGLGSGRAEANTYDVKPINMSITLKEDGELKPVKSVELKCEVQGGSLTIQTVVPESTRVKQGDLLVKLASDEFEEKVLAAKMELDSTTAALFEAQQGLAITVSENESALDKAQVAYAIAELELQRYLNGEYERSLNGVNINIKKTEAELERKEDEYQKSLPLLEKGFVTRSRIMELEATLDQLRRSLENYQLEKSTLEKYEYPKNVKEKEAAVRQAREELGREQTRAESKRRQAEMKVKEQEGVLEQRQSRHERLKEQLAKCEIKAPLDGVVQYGELGEGWWSGSRIAAGEQVHAGQTLVTIPDTTQMLVSTRIHEADRHQISEGLPAIVRVPAVPGKTFRGTVSKIAQFADSERSWLNPDLKEHATEIRLEDNNTEVSPGDSAQVEILIEELHDVLAVPVQCVFARGAKRFVFVQRLTGGEPVEVKLGRANATMVEITSGLTTGDNVLMHADEHLLARLPAPTAVQPDFKMPEKTEPRAAEAAPAAKTDNAGGQG